MDLKKIIRTIPDYPKPGILFYDISTLLINPDAWRWCIDKMTNELTHIKPDILVGIEARGFLLAAPLSFATGIGFTMIRKKGKLPGEVISLDYELEYGQDSMEIQADAIKRGNRVVILDDLLATGGTMGAGVELIKKSNGNPIQGMCIIELEGMDGRARAGVDISSQVVCPS